MTISVTFCHGCKGQKFIHVPAKVVDGVSYPMMKPCDECGGSGFPRRAGPTDPAVVKPPRSGGKGRDWKAAAEAWIDYHPHVIEVFMRMARTKAAKKKKFGIGALVEVVRWECDDLKMAPISNNFRAYIARHLIVLDPSLEKFIEFRETRW